MRGPPRGGSFRGGFDAPESDAGSDRGGRRPFFEGDGKVRDFGNWERKGPLTPAEPAPRGDNEGRSERPARADGGFRDRQAGWGEGTGRTFNEEDGSRPPRREFSERPPPVERQPTAADMDNQWRTKMKPDAPAPTESEASTPTSPAAPAAPASRPRLNLAKRTVSEAPQNAEAGASSDSKASPFGAARPIDTGARERELEEKRQLAIRTKKEHQDKEREERRAAKEREPRDVRKESVTSQSDRPASKSNAKDTEETKEPAAPGLKYEILRRGEGDEDATADADGDAEATNANGNIIGDKEVKPQEITREVPKGGNNWRKPAAETETTADSLDADGWSTVSKKEKNFNKRGGGNAGGRAMAS